MKTQENTFEDELNLREIVQTLLGYKWLFLGAALIAAIIAYFVSGYSIPGKYKSTVLVTVAEPGVTATLENRIDISPQLPEPVTLSDLALTDDLLVDVYQSQEVSNLLDSKLTLTEFKSNASVSVLGLDNRGQAKGAIQVQLQVVDTDPVRAAQIANTWAEKVADRINTAYGLTPNTVDQLEPQVEIARQNWDETEQTLLNSLPEINVEILAMKLNQGKSSAGIFMDKLTTSDLLIIDVHTLQYRLNTLNKDAELQLGDYLNLLTLQQGTPISFVQYGFQIEMPLGERSSDYLTTVGEAQTALEVMLTSLELQRNEIQEKYDSLQEEIQILVVRHEKERYELDALVEQRDLALNVYQALAGQLEEIRISIGQDDQVAKISVVALPPGEPFSPRPIVNAALAASVSLMVTLVIVIVIEWWRQPVKGNSDSHKENVKGKPG